VITPEEEEEEEEGGDQTSSGRTMDATASLRSGIFAASVVRMGIKKRVAVSNGVPGYLEIQSVLDY